jgi:cephalosporin hydroxylase
MKLQSLGLIHNTDKAGIHTFNGRTFLDNYETYFSSLEKKEITFLELGILNGGSLKVWENYFTNGQIIGLDIDPAKKQYETNKIKIYTGSQNDINLIEQIKTDYPLGFDVVLDDASHVNDLTISSFELLFPYVKPGGLYIIEDTHCTYDRARLEWPGMRLNNPDTNFNNNRKTFLDFISQKIQLLDHQAGDIFSITFYSETLVIQKIK